MKRTAEPDWAALLRRDAPPPPPPQKLMPRSASSVFITSPSFMSAPIPGTTIAVPPAASTPFATFCPFPIRWAITIFTFFILFTSPYI